MAVTEDSQGIRLLARATDALVEDAPKPSSQLLDRVMHVVRSEGRSTDLAIASERGTTAVSGSAVARVLRDAVDREPGIRARGCRVVPGEVRREEYRAELSVSIRYGVAGIEDRLYGVRRRVRAAASGRIGVVIADVDIAVVDVWQDIDAEAPT